MLGCVVGGLLAVPYSRRRSVISCSAASGNDENTARRRLSGMRAVGGSMSTTWRELKLKVRFEPEYCECNGSRILHENYFIMHWYYHVKDTIT